MPELVMQARALPLDDSWDVIVVGGGPAGCAAAIAAAREGARTLLVEATSCLGGMGTAGLVFSWAPLSYAGPERICYGGLVERVIRESRKGIPHADPQQLAWIPINPEHLKRVYDDLVTGAGAQVLFQTALAAVETEAGAVSALILSNKAGLSAYRARVYVDGTGDGDLAAWAGAEFEKGDETGDLQPVTLCCLLSNVDTSQFGTDLPRTAIPTERYPLLPPGTKVAGRVVGPGTVGCGIGHIWEVDGTDPHSLTAAFIQGRKMGAELQQAYAEVEPRAFGDCFLAATAPLMGVRETRRILGDYVLTLEDFQAVRTFPDEICRNCFSIDVHVSREEMAEILARGEDVSGVSQRHYHKLPAGESYGIPYRCLTPRGISNVLVAGRCISTDRLVQGSIRAMPACLATGEGAGLAAALAAKQARPDVHAVDTATLRTRLREEGAYLP